MSQAERRLRLRQGVGSRVRVTDVWGRLWGQDGVRRGRLSCGLIAS